MSGQSKSHNIASGDQERYSQVCDDQIIEPEILGDEDWLVADVVMDEPGIGRLALNGTAIEEGFVRINLGSISSGEQETYL